MDLITPHPQLSSLCESAGSEAAILIVLATIFVAGLVALIFFMSKLFVVVVFPLMSYIKSAIVMVI